MPYIKQEDRERLEKDPTDVKTAGDLNYLIFKYAKTRFTNYQSLNDIIADIEECIKYFSTDYNIDNNIDNILYISNNKIFRICHTRRPFDSKLSDKDIIGALRCCELEIYRRLAAPYEDLKIKENGDVE